MTQRPVNAPCSAADRPAATVLAIVASLFMLTGGHIARAQDLPVGIIDFYGLNRVSEAAVRDALPIKEGGTLSLGGEQRPAVLSDIETRLSNVPGVARARANVVCCDAGRALVYVGIEEVGAPAMRFGEAPTGAVRLADDIVRAGADFSVALLAAVQQGRAAEDDSQGHALFDDPATRAVQVCFITFAARDLPQLRRVLRESSDESHRALAAQVLGYAADKQGVVDDLVAAMKDPSEDVRNNAMRALGVFARMAPGPTRAAVKVPYGPFVELLRSPCWTDLNKAAMALMALSEGRDPALLALLRDQGLHPLIEMARWRSEGHAFAAFTILGRIAGLTDEETQAAWTRGDREPLLRRLAVP